MSINQKIYDFYEENIEQFAEVNSKVKTIEELIIDLENQRKKFEFKDGQYENWLNQIESLENRLKEAKESLRPSLDLLIEFNKLIPLDKSIFVYKKLRFEKNNGCISIRAEKDGYSLPISYQDNNIFEQNINKAIALLE